MCVYKKGYSLSSTCSIVRSGQNVSGLRHAAGLPSIERRRAMQACSGDGAVLHQALLLRHTLPCLPRQGEPLPC